jgi:hypothetical protein
VAVHTVVVLLRRRRTEEVVHAPAALARDGCRASAAGAGVEWGGSSRRWDGGTRVDLALGHRGERRPGGRRFLALGRAVEEREAGGVFY